MTLLAWILCVSVIGVHSTVTSGFKSYPTTVKTFENDTVLLPCYAEDLGVQTRVRWWKESNILLADTSNSSFLSPKRVKMWENRSLEVSHVQAEDTGEYVCQVSRPSPWGHVTQVHEIEVMYPPSVHPVPESGELEVNLGEEVDMACVAKGVPVPIISWRTKDGEIPLLDFRPRLTFHAENRNLSGRYTCVANNGVGDPALAYIDLRVRYKPEIEIRKTWVHASPGIRAQLDCRVTAWPEAKVEWFFRDEKVPYSSRIVKHSADNDHSLVIRNVRPTDFGYYICRASSSLGITEGIVELSGVGNPAIFKESQSIARTTYNFIWEVDSYSPIIEYQFWFRSYTREVRGEWHKLFIPFGGDAIGPVHARSFNLTGLREATHYEALVLSRNRYGWSRPSKVLRFATEGASTNAEENYKNNDLPGEQITPVVQLASMSQHSPLDADRSGSSRKRDELGLVTLSVLFVSIEYLIGRTRFL